MRTRRLWRPQTAAFSSLALASLVLGSRGSFTRFFEISCCRFEISIRRPEAHLAGRGRAPAEMRCVDAPDGGPAGGTRPGAVPAIGLVGTESKTID
jgi:hypothetical protein